MKNLGFISYLAFAVLGSGGMALLGFLVSGENVPEADLNIKSRDYEPINPSNIDVAANTAWTPPTPQSQGENWLFGVFTPPKIYKHPKTGAFTAVPYIEEKAPEIKPEIPKPPFGLAFTSLYKQPFRVAVQSVIASPQGDFIQMEIRNFAPPAPGVSEFKILEKRGLNGAPKQYFDQEKFRIEGIEARQIRDSVGNDVNIDVVKVTDFKDQRTYELRPNEQAMTPYFWVTLQSTSDKTATPVFLKNPTPGTKFSLNQAEYTITALKEGPALSITKSYKHIPREGEEPEEITETKELPLGIQTVAPLPGGTSVPPPVPGGIPPPSIPLPLPPSSLTPTPSGAPPFPSSPPIPPSGLAPPNSPTTPPAPVGLPFPGALPSPN